MDANRGSELVFVYGTLREGASNHHRMRGATCLGTGVVAGILYQVSWYPALVMSDSGLLVVGEVYQVPLDLLKELDEFEGVQPGGLVGEEYERRRVRVVPRRWHDPWVPCPSEEDAWAWVWRKPADDLIELPTGDWLDVVRPR